MTNQLVEFLQADEKRTVGKWDAGKTSVDLGLHCVNRLYANALGQLCQNDICTVADNPKYNSLFIAASSRIAEPLRALVRDYVTMRDALGGISKIVLPFYSTQIHYEEWKSANEAIESALTTAKSHQELVDEVMK